jgi:hypothetical protein
MSNDDTFQNHPEDLINSGIRATVGSLPVVGAALNEFLAYVIGQPAQERRDDFMRETHNKITELAAEFEQFKSDSLRANESFQASFIQATNIATRTVDAGKREVLRNAVLNSAFGTIDENVRQMFMQYIDRLTPLHLGLLKFYDAPAAISAVKKRLENLMSGGLLELAQIAIPGVPEDLLKAVASDLEAMQFVGGGALNVTMTQQGLSTRRTTRLGQEFLKFIAAPPSTR